MPHDWLLSAEQSFRTVQAEGQGTASLRSPRRKSGAEEEAVVSDAVDDAQLAYPGFGCNLQADVGISGELDG